MPLPDARLVASLRRWARRFAAVVIAVGALVFVGWMINSPWLDELLYGRFIMQLNTGLAFVLGGVALLAATRERAQSPASARVAFGAGAAVTAVGAFVLAEDVFGWRLKLVASSSGRMEVETAINFVLVGVALMLLPARREAAARFGQALVALAILVSLAALFGHAYSVKVFFGVTAYTKMTVSALVSFLLLCAGVLFARADRGFMAAVTRASAGGFLARRLLPAVIVVPILLGVAILAGEEIRLYNGKFGLSLLVLGCIVAFGALVSLTVRSLDRTDGARMRLAAVLLEEAERRHIARELHDEIGQSLTALKIRLAIAGDAGGLGEARALVDDLMSRVSNLSLDLRPAMLDDLGLLPALLWLFERYTAQTQIEVAFEHEGLGDRFSPESETAAFRIVQEALTNAARHSGEKRVTVRVWRAPTSATLGVQIEDRGRGFDADSALAAGKSSGLLGMRERAVALGGTLTIEARPGSGTRLHAELPLSPTHRPELAAP
ncbi:MAG TPA: sensor histidine kinase [Polyangia bacterium]|nr:sensor histidine kinase [Polyangia bacterium]